MANIYCASYFQRLLRVITNSPVAKRSVEVSKNRLAKAMILLTQLDEALDDCLNFINLFTGKIECSHRSFVFQFLKSRLYSKDILLLI
jgi:hypothetical protein